MLHLLEWGIRLGSIPCNCLSTSLLSTPSTLIASSMLFRLFLDLIFEDLDRSLFILAVGSASNRIVRPLLRPRVGAIATSSTQSLKRQDPSNTISPDLILDRSVVSPMFSCSLQFTQKLLLHPRPPVFLCLQRHDPFSVGPGIAIA